MNSTANPFHAVNVNPVTGLATDYLNHFNEAIMLLDMLAQCPEFLDDFLAWAPMSYRAHFAASRLKDRDAMIAAYDHAQPEARRQLDTLATAMTTMLEATRIALQAPMPPDQAAELARHIVAMLKPLIARAGAAINGVPDDSDADLVPQATIDRLLVA